jgi:flagellin-like hook-associated protein FlgL
MAAAGLGTVSMSLNIPPTAFVVDDFNVPPLGLTIEDVTIDEQTASQLGMAGFIGSGMVGGDLNPEASFEITDTTGTTAADLGITGMYSSQTSGADIDPRLTLTSDLTDLRNFLGLDDTQFVIWQGERRLTVDLSDTTINTVQDLLDHINNSGLDVTASINSSGRGIQIENDDPNRSLTIEEEGSQRTARQMGIYGSSDMMGTLLVLINALMGNDQEGVGLLLQYLDEAITVGLDNRATVGAAAMRLEATDSRLVDLDLSYTRLLSEVEDADLTKVVSDLSTYENNYRAALQAASRIIQPSLLDFLQ